jgi:hypothetical protein
MPYPEPRPVVVQAPRWAGVGLDIPERKADCSGVRPSWFPFAVNVCECCDTPDPEPLSGRQLTVPPPASNLPFPRTDPCA